MGEAPDWSPAGGLPPCPGVTWEGNLFRDTFLCLFSRRKNDNLSRPLPSQLPWAGWEWGGLGKSWGLLEEGMELGMKNQGVRGVREKPGAEAEGRAALSQCCLPCAGKYTSQPAGARILRKRARKREVGRILNSTAHISGKPRFKPEETIFPKGVQRFICSTKPIVSQKTRETSIADQTPSCPLSPPFLSLPSVGSRKVGHPHSRARIRRRN